MMISLGSGSSAFEFSISTAAFQQLQRSSTYTWAAQKRIRNWPGKQWGGPTDDRITIDGTIMCGLSLPGVDPPGARQMDKVRGIGLQGFPQELVTGSGYYYGMYVIESVEDTGKTFTSEGVPQQQTFQITLSRYTKDQMLDNPAVVSNKGALNTTRQAMMNINTGNGNTGLF